MTLTEFLLARIADREMLARDMQHQAAMGRPLLLLRGGGTLIRELVDPAQVLADCEAKRRIVDMLVVDGVIELGGINGGIIARHLAAIYADHPDYDETWRP